MFSLQRRLTLVGFLLLTCGKSAIGGNYADPSGFSFTYPEDWIAITRSAMGDVNSVEPQELKDWLAKNVDLNRVAVALIRNDRDEFLESLNVVVSKQEISLDDEAVKRMTDTMAQRYRAAGMVIDNLQRRVRKVGSHDALVVEFQARLPGIPFPLWQRQVLFAGGGNTYFVTCTAKADSFIQHLPAFERILASFQVPPRVAIGFDWSQIGTIGAVGGIIGGLIAGLIGITKRRRGPPP